MTSPTKRPNLTVKHLVPGGILSTDLWHVATNDQTCSRCCRKIGDDEVPVMLFSGDGENMLIYCEVCLASDC